MATVFVLSENGKPLMPTTRCGHVRQLLKQNKARVVAIKPFTIKLLLRKGFVQEIIPSSQAVRRGTLTP